MLTYSNIDATLLEASFSVPFAGVAFAVIFNPCGGAVEADCQGYSDRASVDEALGTVSMTAAQMAKVFSGEITSWAALGA